jgi:hypothetical protein
MTGLSPMDRHIIVMHWFRNFCDSPELIASYTHEHNPRVQRVSARDTQGVCEIMAASTIESLFEEDHDFTLLSYHRHRKLEHIVWIILSLQVQHGLII